MSQHNVNLLITMNKLILKVKTAMRQRVQEIAVQKMRLIYTKTEKRLIKEKGRVTCRHGKGKLIKD